MIIYLYLYDFVSFAIWAIVITNLYLSTLMLHHGIRSTYCIPWLLCSSDCDTVQCTVYLTVMYTPV